MRTKTLALRDAPGTLVRLVPPPDSASDRAAVAPPIGGLEVAAPIADTAFDSNAIIAALNDPGATLVIAQPPRRTTPLQIDAEMYKGRRPIQPFCRKRNRSSASPAYCGASSSQVRPSSWIASSSLIGDAASEASGAAGPGPVLSLTRGLRRRAPRCRPGGWPDGQAGHRRPCGRPAAARRRSCSRA
jgi:hypothetical protein